MLIITGSHHTKSGWHQPCSELRVQRRITKHFSVNLSCLITVTQLTDTHLTQTHISYSTETGLALFWMSSMIWVVKFYKVDNRISSWLDHNWWLPCTNCSINCSQSQHPDLNNPRAPIHHLQTCSLTQKKIAWTNQNFDKLKTFLSVSQGDREEKKMTDAPTFLL